MPTKQSLFKLFFQALFISAIAVYLHTQVFTITFIECQTTTGKNCPAEATQTLAAQWSGQRLLTSPLQVATPAGFVVSSSARMLPQTIKTIITPYPVVYQLKKAGESATILADSAMTTGQSEEEAPECQITIPDQTSWEEALKNHQAFSSVCQTINQNWPNQNTTLSWQTDQQTWVEIKELPKVLIDLQAPHTSYLLDQLASKEVVSQLSQAQAIRTASEEAVIDLRFELPVLRTAP